MAKSESAKGEKINSVENAKVENIHLAAKSLIGHDFSDGYTVRMGRNSINKGAAKSNRNGGAD